MRKALVFPFLIVIILASPCLLHAQENHKPFSIDLVGGYTVLPMMVNGVDWKIYDTKKEDVNASDDSYLNPSFLGGLAFTYVPTERFISAGFTFECFYQKHEGKLKGTVGNNRQNRDSYDYHMTMDYYQINFLVSVYFSQKAFQPYARIGMGAVRNDAEFDSYHQTAYGAAGVMVWGAQYHFIDWFALGGQVRCQDLFALTYWYEPTDDSLVTMESQFIPLSFLIHTTFKF